MARRGSRDVAVGSVFALALVILALAVMAVGGELPGLSNRVRFQVLFPNADGLLPGAPVRMNGVQVGTVSDIRLPTDPEVRGIEVQVSIQSAYAPRVRSDSTAALRILQLLTNEKYVEVFAGSAEQPQLDAGAILPTLEDSGILQQGEAIAENLIDITASLKQILEPLQKGDSLLGRIIQDPEFGMAGVEAFGGALENTEKLTADFRAGRGVVGRLLYDEELAGKLDGLGSALEDFSELMDELGRSETVHQLLSDDGAAQQAILDLRDAAGSIKRLTERMESDSTMLGQLLSEQECSASVATNLCSTLADLAEVTRRINDGEGTLGALITDRSLYDGAEDLVSGTNDSKFARWLLRRYRKKGIVAAEQEATSPAGAAPGPE